MHRANEIAGRCCLSAGGVVPTLVTFPHIRQFIASKKNNGVRLPFLSYNCIKNCPLCHDATRQPRGSGSTWKF